MEHKWTGFACGWLLLLLVTTVSMAETGLPDQADEDVFRFGDAQLEEELVHPGWFKTTFGDLRDDLSEALANGKKGLIVYFGQKRCSYCEKFLNNNLANEDIQSYLRNHFDVVAIDIWGIEDITTLDGEVMSEREFSVRENTNFTPSLIFYDRDGRQAMRLRGYYPPYQFRAALKYIVERFYREESFRDYLSRADAGMVFDSDGLNEQDFFYPPPYNLDRSRLHSDMPLVVFFEQGRCHACDVLHTGPLLDPRLRAEIVQMEAIQLDMWSDTPVVTPSGERTTARQWASDLGLFFAPAMLFFDEKGDEIMRVDSVAQFYRLLGVFDYINKRAYKQYPNYQQWRLIQRDILR